MAELKCACFYYLEADKKSQKFISESCADFSIQNFLYISRVVKIKDAKLINLSLLLKKVRLMEKPYRLMQLF